MLSIHKFVFSLFGENTYLLIDQATKQAAVIDPGMADQEEIEAFDSAVERLGANVTQIINTHMHLDHCFGANYVKQRYGAKLHAHAADRALGLDMAQQIKQMHLRIPGGAVEIDVELKEGDVVEIGESRLQVLHVPGHSPGGIALYWKEGGVVFVGDSLFPGSIGRTDLAGGDMATLLQSVKSKLFTLPDDTVVLSGHGEPTQIGREKRTNPFFR